MEWCRYGRQDVIPSLQAVQSYWLELLTVAGDTEAHMQSNQSLSLIENMVFRLIYSSKLKNMCLVFLELFCRRRDDNNKNNNENMKKTFKNMVNFIGTIEEKYGLSLAATNPNLCQGKKYFYYPFHDLLFVKK